MKRNSSKQNMKNALKNMHQGFKNSTIKPVIIADIVFFVSFVLTLVFGSQTNTAFFVPFIISLILMIISALVILVDAGRNILKNRGSKKNKRNKKNV